MTAGSATSTYGKTMWRAPAPSLALATAVMAVAGIVYGHGAPAWIVYAAIVPAVLSVLPAEERWERQQHPR
jgi:hypothetical protein